MSIITESDHKTMFGPEYRQQDIEMSEFQREFLAVPECYHVCLLGGRGGGKSYALALAALRHTVKHGENARWLLLWVSLFFGSSRRIAVIISRL